MDVTQLVTSLPHSIGRSTDELAGGWLHAEHRLYALVRRGQRRLGIFGQSVVSLPVGVDALWHAIAGTRVYRRRAAHRATDGHWDHRIAECGGAARASIQQSLQIEAGAGKVTTPKVAALFDQKDGVTCCGQLVGCDGPTCT